MGRSCARSSLLRAVISSARHKDGRSRKGYDTQRSVGAHHPDDLMTLFITPGIKMEEVGRVMTRSEAEGLITLTT